MCGIAGIIRITPASSDADTRRHALTRPHAEAIPEAWLDLLDASIRHRGPDGQGRFRDRAARADGAIIDVALVHRRLSIIDHSGGAQPMVSLRGPIRAARSSGPAPHARDGTEAAPRLADDRELLPPPLLFHGQPAARVEYRPIPARPGDNLVAVVFNGCIYNHRALRHDLHAAGHRFETDHSDTEVLLHGWRESGLSFVERLDAMYAFAAWDRAAASLTVARDPFGEKPLYLLGGTDSSATVLVFGSTHAGLLALHRAHNPASREWPMSEGLDAWIRFGYDGPTPGRATATLPPSHAFDLAQPAGPWIGHTTPWTRRGAAWPPRDQSLSADEADRAITDSVAARLEADVPVACLLSGGVDSSVVAAMARRSRPDLVAFTVRMPDARYDESRFASAAAGALGLRHHVLDADPRPADDLQRLIAQLGLPLGDSSLLPAAWAARAVRSHAGVCLGGDGGDEMFIGYERSRAAEWLRRFGPCLRLAPAGIMPQADPRSKWSKLARLIRAARGERYLDLLSIFPSEMLPPLLGRSPRPRVPLEPFDGLERALLYDAFVHLPGDYLRKTDTASMAAALELRSPFLARGVAMRCLQTRTADLLPRGQLKGLLRQVARMHLPPEIIDRPKQGFAIPIGEWFRTDFGGLRTLLLDRLHSREPFGPPSLGIELNRRFIQRLLDEHLGSGPSGLVRRDHSQRLYMLLVLSIWSDTLR